MYGYVRMTLDKLSGITANLVRTYDNRQEWKFMHLVEALKKWTERNPLPMDHERSEHFNEKFNHKQGRKQRANILMRNLTISRRGNKERTF